MNKLRSQPLHPAGTPARGALVRVGRRARDRPGPVGGAPAGRHCRGTYEGWMTSYGVYGHLLDSLSAWGHSATLFKPEQAHFGRFYGIMFFRQDSLKSAGRCHADPRINTRPGGVALAGPAVRRGGPDDTRQQPAGVYTRRARAARRGILEVY